MAWTKLIRKSTRLSVDLVFIREYGCFERRNLRKVQILDQGTCLGWQSCVRAANALIDPGLSHTPVCLFERK